MTLLRVNGLLKDRITTNGLNVDKATRLPKLVEHNGNGFLLIPTQPRPEYCAGDAYPYGDER